VADILTTGGETAVTGPAAAEAAAQATRYTRTGQMLADRAQNLVKGAGYIGNGNAPLQDQGLILTKAHNVALSVRTESDRAYRDTDSVIKSISPDFWRAKPNLYQSAMLGSQALKSFTAGNLGLPGVPFGLVPFDLLAPSRLIYPVYTVLRNKLPRPPGQGESRQVYGLLGVSGSQTGGQGVMDIAIPELVNPSGGNLSGTNWPLNLPPSGSQTEYKLNVPYKFFGITEALSWLAQFEGQGLEDMSSLANLVLLQEAMMAEEYAMLAHSSQKIPTPGAPALTARNAGSGESPLTGVTTNVFVVVTALNYYGETAASASASVAVSSGQVVDVTISPVPGAQQYNLYVSTGSTAGTFYLMAGASRQNGSGGTTGTITLYRGTQTGNSVGGVRFTLQGALPTSGAEAMTADSGTGSPNRMEGIIPTLTGLSASGSGPYANAVVEGPSISWQGGYVNQAVGTHLSYNAVYEALDGLWETNGINNDSPGAFRADPAEILGDGGDIMRLSNDVIAQGASTNYRLFLEQSDVPGVRVGAAVSEFQNPITRSVLKLVVHPWMSQGTALLMTYQLPQTWSNVANAWEMTMVQDYISVSWPVIDASFRYSLFFLGALVAHAPFYSGILQGLQVSDTTPFQ